jgi:hypothetical protein
MEPVKSAGMNVVYRGGGEVGDLWCYRPEPGHILTLWQPDEEELKALNEGGSVVLHLLTEPIPPIAIGVMAKKEVGETKPVRFRESPELDDPERQ